MRDVFAYFRQNCNHILQHKGQTKSLFFVLIVLLLVLFDISSAIFANPTFQSVLHTSAYAAAGVTHYVAPYGLDTNPGTQTLPWRTWHKAATSTYPGETSLFLDGTYNEDNYSYFSAAGTANAPVVLKSQNPRGAKIIFGAGANNTERIYVTGTYYTFDGFDISSTVYTPSSSADNGFRFWAGANHATVKNCNINNMMIAAKSNADYTLFENIIVGSATTPSPGALEFFGNVGGIMRRNTVYYSSDYAGALNAKGGARSVQMYDNVVHIVGDSYLGIDLGGFSNGQSGVYDTSGWEIWNSVAFNNVVIIDAGGRAYGGIGTTGGNTIGIYNNVVIGAERGIYTDWGGEDIGVGNWTNTTPGNRNGDPPVVNVTFINNLILNSTKRAADMQGLQTGTVADVDYNDFYNNAGSAFSQAHPITGNPLFVNTASDWHLAATSPAIGRGATIPDFKGFNGETMSIAFDRNNLTRTTPWDLGIYESDGTSSLAPPAPTLLITSTPTPTVIPTVTLMSSTTATPQLTAAPSSTPIAASVPVQTSALLALPRLLIPILIIW